MYSWLIDHWIIISLVISELLAFIPARYNGIAQAVVRVLSAIFGSKTGNELPKSSKKF